MALSKDKKAEVVSRVAELLDSSKLTVLAKYSGTSVKSMQQLRKQAAENGTKIHVIKNRLVKKALQTNDKFKQVDLDLLSGQLLYAFNSEDEVAPAQSLAAFAKLESQVEFVGGLNADGQFVDAEDIRMLASLPGKDQLRAQLAGTISAPLNGFVNVLSANVRGVLNVLSARAEQLN
jgi:large subunit ribosomal protein L10